MCRRKLLDQIAGGRLSGRQLVVVSNRGPYVFRSSGRCGEVEQPAGGLVEALRPVVQATDGLWIAWGSADPRTADGRDRVGLPSKAPRFRLRRVRLSEKVVENYYYGYANQALWPLFHTTVAKARFLDHHWRGYVEANRRFAEAVIEEAEQGALVWLQDYHLALCPRAIRSRRPDVVLAHFWHIPWPAWDVFQACPRPQRRAILTGLLANDLVGFHLPRYSQAFLDCVGRELDADVDVGDGYIDYRGRRTAVRAAPISIDMDYFEEMARSPAGEWWMAWWRSRPEIAGRRVAIGVDRLDYTKGIPERLRAIDCFLSQNPDQTGLFVFVQKVAASRTKIEAYRSLQRAVESLVRQINARHGTDGWLPILYVPEMLPRAALAALYRMADLAIVSSLQDGMNLVAKEFVASQVDARGVLLLSEFCGAAAELHEALPINPSEEGRFAGTIKQALAMPLDERSRRMKAMRAYLRQHDVYWWAREIMAAVSSMVAGGKETRRRAVS